jgi:succinate dehydrogenase / fumarate reductase flavoprotein subunit
MIDVLIIGSGGAGLSAALASKNKSNTISVISKTLPTHSQTCQAQGGINAVLYEGDDSIQNHINDTYEGSKELSNKDHIKYLCEKAKETILWLDSMGVPFNRDNNSNISQRKFGGTSKIRTCYSSDYTGLKILHTLYDQCIKNNINFINEHFILELIKVNNKCTGVVALDILSGEIKTIKAKTVIIASGGYAGIYSKHTTNSYSNTGDGLMLAYNSGAILSNLEFIQFHPTALKDKNILISESARGEGGYLVDKNQNRFIDELKTRDEVARAIFDKINNDEEVYLDLRHLGESKIKEQLPQEYELAKLFLNIELDKELLPINPTAHYSMGGIKTNLECETNIENLYACGECAQSDIHGANRLGGNSLLEIITFGKKAGENASKKSQNTQDIQNHKSIDYQKKTNQIIDNIYKNDKKESIYKTKDELGSLLFENLGLYRNESCIKQLISKINKIKNEFFIFGIEDKSKVYNKNLLEYLEFKNIVDLSLLISKSAIERKESRGSHFRTDYPNENIDYMKRSMVSNKSDEIYFEEIR